MMARPEDTIWVKVAWREDSAQTRKVHTKDNTEPAIPQISAQSARDTTVMRIMLCSGIRLSPNRGR